MIEPIVYLGISFLFAGLIAWAAMPLVRSRTARLTAQQIFKLLDSYLEAELDKKSDEIDRLKRECDVLKTKIDALQSQVGPATQETDPTIPPSARPRPMFLPLDTTQREQFAIAEIKETPQDTQDEDDRPAQEEPGKPGSLRVVTR
jgi:hypothetical protein